MAFDSSTSVAMGKKMETYLTRINNMLATNAFSSDPTVIAGNIGRPKPFINFYFPHDRTASVQGMKGKNVVFTNSSILDKDEIEDAITKVSYYGEGDKILIGTPAFIARVYRSLAADPQIRISMDGFKLPGSEYIWDGITVKTHTGLIHLVADFTLEGKQMALEDNCLNTALGINTVLWGLVIDTVDCKIVFRDVQDDKFFPGLQVPTIKPVETSRNSSVNETEINSEFMLYVRRPEVGGYWGVAG